MHFALAFAEGTVTFVTLFAFIASVLDHNHGSLAISGPLSKHLRLSAIHFKA